MPGRTYLVQHSAGSGKSNTIAWLAHRLSSLHDAADTKVFDKVVVITDRVVLDRQLQDTIYQFEHAHGVVVKIDEDSGQLADALAGRAGADHHHDAAEVPVRARQGRRAAGQRRYAVIVDEAHSSQTGEAAKDLRLALGATEETGADRRRGRGHGPHRRRRSTRSRRRSPRRSPPGVRQPNLSFFAFTATPKAQDAGAVRHARTRPTNRYEPFHLYSMRQAIEEGFILDVLANYTTYETYWQHREGRSPTTPSTTRRKARRAIARFVTLHQHNLAQKAEIIVEHFRSHVAHKIGGQAKAMVVTASRLHAVRYKQALDKYIAEHGYGDVGVLVAFSGTVDDDGVDFTEAEMNGFPDTQTAERVRHRRVPGARRRREVPDRLRPAAAVHHVRRQGAHRPRRRADPVAAEPHPRRQGRHVRPRLPQRRRRHPRRVRAVLRHDRRPADRPEPALRHPPRARRVRRAAAPTRSNASPACCSTMATPSDHGRIHAALAPGDRPVPRPRRGRPGRLP